MKTRPLLAHWRQDLPASLVVFLVALPLCLGIAVASGAPPLSGIIAGIIGGLVVGALSGSPLGVSGPAAGLTALVLVGTAELGSFEALLAATVAAGVVQVIMGFLRAGIIAHYFPSSVIKGMLAGIGVIIILKQIPHAFGYDKDPMGDESFDQPDHHTTFSELAYMVDEISVGAVIVTVVCLGLMLLWERPAFVRHAFLRSIPGPLLAVVAGTALAAWFNFSEALPITVDHFVSLPARIDLGALPRPDFHLFLSPVFWKTAITIAIVASLETLLCVEATDKMDPRKRITPADRELKAQGVGNILSGLLGGLPLTQVVVRSSANIQSGGATRLSAMLHGLLLLVSVLTVGALLAMIPLASLAAILLLVGYKLAKPSLFVSMWNAGLPQFAPFIITVGFMAVTNDLLRGVALGLVVAFLHILWKNFRVPFHFDPNKHRSGEPIRIELSEDVTFLNKAGIKRTLAALPAGARVIVDASRTMDLDPDVREIIAESVVRAQEDGILIEFIEPQKAPAPHSRSLRSTVLRAAGLTQKTITH
ncbi:MAG: SulP family inorganic anion transporter [Flavobacteriales bacterium]|nr:SulP family inorganic anion transporter [Flavobacteriales bacterium]